MIAGRVLIQGGGIGGLIAGPVKATLIPLSAGDCYLALVAPEVTPQHGLSGPDIVTQMRACCRGSVAGSARCVT